MHTSPTSKLGRRLALAGFALGALVGAAYLGADIIGWSRLQTVRRALASSGGSLELKDYLPAPIPPAENFCAIPFLDGIAAFGDSAAAKAAKEKRLKIESLYPGNDPSIARPHSSLGPFSGVPLDAAELAAELRKDGYLATAPAGPPAQEILSLFTKMDPLLAQMAGALDRPGAQWTPPIAIGSGREAEAIGEQPETRTTLGLTKWLGLRGVLAAQAGDMATALASWRMSERLRRATAELPTEINLLLSVDVQDLENAIIWECARGRIGTAAEWRILEREQSAIDYRQIALRCFEGERACSRYYAAQMRSERSEHPFLKAMLRGDDYILEPAKRSWALSLLVRLLPQGVYDWNAANLALLETRHLVDPLRKLGWENALAQRGNADAQLWPSWVNPRFGSDPIGAASTIYSQALTFDQVVQTVTTTHQATIACSLELYRLAHGQYPEKLAGLTLTDGRPFPPDPYDGAPMRYRRTADGRYALWSVDFDLKDDNGRRARANDGTRTGDWVWSFSAEDEMPKR